MRLFDTLTLDKSSARKTSDGYLVASALIARTGIQLYAGAEVGRPDLSTVRVYRPPEEVFSKDSLASFAHKPLTNDHPTTKVDASNWRALAVGNVGDEVARDGEMVRVPLIVMDATAIADIESGKRELSAGYDAELVWEAGQTPEGLQYDAKQTNIRDNHVAIVDRARGGKSLRIEDDNMAGETPKLRTITVDGLPFEVNDAAAVIIERLVGDVAKAKAATTDAEAKLAAQAATHSTQIAAKDAEIVALKGKIPDAASLAGLVKDHLSVAAAAAKLEPKLKLDGLDTDGIRKAVVDARMKDGAKGYTVDQYRVAFDTLSQVAAAHPIINNGQPDPLRTAIQTSVGDADPRAAALAERNKGLVEGYKGSKAA